MNSDGTIVLVLISILIVAVLIMWGVSYATTPTPTSGPTGDTQCTPLQKQFTANVTTFFNSLIYYRNNIPANRYVQLANASSDAYITLNDLLKGNNQEIAMADVFNNYFYPNSSN